MRKKIHYKHIKCLTIDCCKEKILLLVIWNWVCTWCLSAETPAQKQARMDADIKLNAGAFWWLWSWGMRPAAKSQQEGHGRARKGENEWPWKGLFGPSSRSDLLMVSLTPAEAQKVSQIPVSSCRIYAPITNTVSIHLPTGIWDDWDGKNNVVLGLCLT